MEPTQKKRVNLYIDQQILDFGKRYSYVTGESLSSLFENFLRIEEEKTSLLTVEQFLSYNAELEDNWYHYSGKYSEDQENSIQNFLADEDEINFCRNNPDSIRAKLRIQLVKEQEERDKLISEKIAIENKRREQERLEFIKRWNETFK